jgi:hypothetical protein
MTLTKIRMDCSSTRKNSDKVRASSNSERAIRHWRVCRSESNKQDLDGCMDVWMYGWINKPE